MTNAAESDWGELMSLAQKGDAEAYYRLLKTLDPYIRKFCFKKVAYLNIADDVVQESLMAIHKYRHTYDAAKPFKPWLHTIVKSKAIDALRARHRIAENELQNDERLSEIPAAEGGTGQNLDVQDLLKKIPEEFRVPIELMKLQSFTVEDVAAKLNLSPSSVKMRVHRGLKLLKELAEGNIYE